MSVDFISEGLYLNPAFAMCLALCDIQGLYIRDNESVNIF